MIVINYGLYDFFGEIEYSAVTAKSSTALGIIKDDLHDYIQTEIEECERSIGQSWAQDKLIELSDALIELGKINTIDQYHQHELFHYEEWEVSGKFDKEL